jgi:hypothetical protein
MVLAAAAAFAVTTFAGRRDDAGSAQSGTADHR